MSKEKMRFPIRRKITLMVFVIALSLSAILIVTSYTHYRTEMFEHYENFAMNIGAVAASQIDPDRIQGYLETGVKDEEYERTFSILCDIRENGGVEYLYVVKPEEEEVWYLMDTDPSEDAIPLGFHEPYYEGAFRENAQRMARGERIEPLISDEEFGWLMSVYYPLRTSAGMPAGYVGVDIRMNDVQEDLRNFAIRSIVLMLALTVIFSALLIVISSRTLAVPIRRLSTAAEQLVAEEQAGETTGSSIFSQLSVRTGDEVEALYGSLAQMERDINAYISDLVNVTAEKERIGAELNVAAQIQADMLPRIFPPFPERHEFDLYASMKPAKEVGGDFYDFFLIDDDHIGLVMADVSGKGVPAALFMVIAKTLIKNRAQMGGGPGEILEYVNGQLCEGNEAELFVTVWLAILEISTGRGLAANAGHEHPVIRRANGAYEPVIYRHSPAVATMEGLRFKEHSFELQPGDTLFVYTDGVTEATDANNALFGMDGMLAALNAVPDAAPEALIRGVHGAIDRFVGRAPQFDDVTMLALRYDGPDTPPDVLRVPAQTEELKKVLAFVDSRLEAADCPVKTQLQIDVAVEEIFVNIAHYAYADGDGTAEITARVEGDPAEAVIEFRDAGVPYDPLSRPDPDVTLSAEDRRIGGLGIYMVKKSMDAVRYRHEDGRNVLTIRKRI